MSVMYSLPGKLLTGLVDVGKKYLFFKGSQKAGSRDMIVVDGTVSIMLQNK